MFRGVVVYGAYFSKFLKARLSYKGDFLASMMASALVSVSGLLFVFFLIDGETVPELKGWSRDEVLFIYGYSMLPLAIFSLLSPNLYQFGDRYVIQGQFDRVLLRPLNTLGQVVFETFNLESIGNFVVGICVLVYAKGQLGLEFTLVDYGWLLLSSVSGAMILVSVFVFFASLSFHFEDRLGISAPVFNLIAFGRYPLPIFNNLIQFILSWVIPFAFVSFFPATHFLNHNEFSFLCYFSLVVAVLSLLVAAIAWIFGVSRYSSTGS